jgi:DNA-binding transcriptional regulator YhcF (GntR family)
MIYGLGPRAQRVFTILRDRISRGDWAPGTQLPSHRDLAIELGVAPLTMRQVLAHLEEQGLVSRRVGRGTFVREASAPTVLILGQDATMGAFLADYIKRSAYRSLQARDLEDALAIISGSQEIILILCDVDERSARSGDPRSPQTGREIIRALRLRHPQLPVAAIVADLDDMKQMFGTAEWPLLLLPKPINLGLLEEVLRLVEPQKRPAP